MKSLMTIIFFAAGAALVFWAAKPLWDEILLLRSEQAEVASTLASLRDLQKLRDELLATYNAIPRDKLNRLMAMIPATSDAETLLVNLEQMSADRKLKLKTINFNREKDRVTPRALAALNEPNVPAMPFTFSVAGSYDSFRALLSGLEKNLRIIDVTSISFIAGSALTMDISMAARSYYQRK